MNSLKNENFINQKNSICLSQEARDRIIVALDCEPHRALELAHELRFHALWLKVGMTLYYSAGPEIVQELRRLGFKVFLDLKMHDIPHQVKGAVVSAASSGADIISLHALGGSKMIAAARKGLEIYAESQAKKIKEQTLSVPALVSITILTSHAAKDLEELGIQETLKQEVSALANIAIASGSDGLVCSVKEASLLRKQLNSEALIITPGVRPCGFESNDQVRVASPYTALSAGADMIVVGRPITEANSALSAYQKIEQELASALQSRQSILDSSSTDSSNTRG